MKESVQAIITKLGADTLPGIRDSSWT